MQNFMLLIYWSACLIFVYGYDYCSICYNTDNWELLSKYSKRFIKAGVKLRQTSFDVWMEFAAKIGPYKFISLDYFVQRCVFVFYFHLLVMGMFSSYLLNMSRELVLYLL